MGDASGSNTSLSHILTGVQTSAFKFATEHQPPSRDSLVFSRTSVNRPSSRSAVSLPKISPAQANTARMPSRRPASTTHSRERSDARSRQISSQIPNLSDSMLAWSVDLVKTEKVRPNLKTQPQTDKSTQRQIDKSSERLLARASRAGYMNSAQLESTEEAGWSEDEEFYGCEASSGEGFGSLGTFQANIVAPHRGNRGSEARTVIGWLADTHYSCSNRDNSQGKLGKPRQASGHQEGVPRMGALRQQVVKPKRTSSGAGSCAREAQTDGLVSENQIFGHLQRSNRMQQIIRTT